jgi:succinate dehydrogenase / fumarate reductase, iron-sulfur subunit
MTRDRRVPRPRCFEEETPDGRQGRRMRPCAVWRGDASGGEAHRLPGARSTRARWSSTSSTGSRRPRPGPGLRWNCKAGKCGSCSAEINGKARLMCMTRMSTSLPRETLTITPMRTFPVIRDLVTDVSFNYAKARDPGRSAPPARGRRASTGCSRSTSSGHQEFRKCIECFLCQNVCHVIRDHEENKRLRRPAVLRPLRRARDAPARHRTGARSLQEETSASATATSPSAAPRCAPSTSRSPTTRSSR